MACALTEEPIVLDLCQKRGLRVLPGPIARRMPASTFAIAGCDASKPCPAIRCAAVIAATRRLRVATTPAFEGSIIKVVEGSKIRVVEGSIIRIVEGSIIRIVGGSIIRVVGGSIIRVVGGSIIQGRRGFDNQ